MQRPSLLPSLLLTLGLLSPATLAQEAPSIRWEAYETMGTDDQPLSGRIGRLTVPEDREDPDGATLELAFVHYPSDNPEPGPPIVVLAGGPGGPGIEVCLGPATGRFVRLLQYGDVIGLDQRGTGRSVPNLADGPRFGYELPLDRPVGADDLVQAYRGAVRRAVDHWTAEGVDLSAYHTSASADDVDDLRRALGLDEIVLWGASYGSHLGLEVLRRHGDHVARAVLQKVEGPDHTLKLPATTQAHLEQLGALVAADPDWGERLPDLVATVADLLDQLAAGDVVVQAAGEDGPVSITLGPLDLQWDLTNRLGQAFALVELPAHLARLAEGDWSGLAGPALELRRGEVGSAMALMMDCASGASPERLALIAEQAADPAHLLGEAVNLPYPHACDAAGSPDLGTAFRQPFACDVPVLFVSGTLDARTPPSNVDEVAGAFSAAAHVVVENAGHEPLEVFHPEYRELLAAFLRGEPVESRTLALPPLPFEPR